ncbi:hypothetical protein EBU24_02045 [bacterium]|jgi:hypothetical protein|nr:hypothetical protein [bacterium]
MATYKRWNDAELQFIRDNLSSFSDTELATKLSEMTGEAVSYGMIRRQRRKLGVVKARGRRKKNTTPSAN